MNKRMVFAAMAAIAIAAAGTAAALTGEEEFQGKGYAEELELDCAQADVQAEPAAPTEPEMVTNGHSIVFETETASIGSRIELESQRFALCALARQQASPEAFYDADGEKSAKPGSMLGRHRTPS